VRHAWDGDIFALKKLERLFGLQVHALTSRIEHKQRARRGLRIRHARSLPGQGAKDVLIRYLPHGYAAMLDDL
jgi:hypothetical protein